MEEAIYPSLMAVGVSGGVRYFLPFRPNVQIAYYNAEKFAQYSLQPPRTWSELLASAGLVCALTSRPASKPGCNRM